jgi:hypothetical protein
MGFPENGAYTTILDIITDNYIFFAILFMQHGGILSTNDHLS